MILYVTFLVKQHIDPGERISTDSDLLFLVSPIPPCCHCIDGHQHLLSLYVCPPCWPNQSGNILCGTHILNLWASRILDGIVFLYIGLIMCLSVLFALIWNIQGTIPVKPILSVGNAVRCTIQITSCWMTVDGSDPVDIKYWSLFSRKVVCKPSWWQRWSFRQLKCSCAIMLKVCPGCLDNLPHIWNVTNGCHLLDLSTRFILHSTEILAALLHVQKLVDLGHSVQFSLLHISLHFEGVFRFCHSECGVVACRYPVFGSSK